MAAKKKKSRKAAPSKTAPRRATKTAKKSSAKRPSAKKVAAKKPARKLASPTIAQYMTSTVHSIGLDQSLALAHQLMNQHRIRHLPVLDGGELVGIVSQRDLYFIEALGDAPPAEIRVEEAMSPDVFVTDSTTPLTEVADVMIRRKLGSAIVKRAGKVVGVFTIIDGLKALLKYLPH